MPDAWPLPLTIFSCPCFACLCLRRSEFLEKPLPHSEHLNSDVELDFTMIGLPDIPDTDTPSPKQQGQTHQSIGLKVIRDPEPLHTLQSMLTP